MRVDGIRLAFGVLRLAFWLPSGFDFFGDVLEFGFLIGDGVLDSGFWSLGVGGMITALTLM